MTLELVPISLRGARRFVGEVHRHSEPPRGWLTGVGLEDGGKLVGVAILGRPTAAASQDGRTAEVTRVATDGTRNACSMLYGAMTRAAAALGYRRLYTYTEEGESGASLKASGWVLDAVLDPRGAWSSPSRPRSEDTLFGERRPEVARLRWVKHLG